MTSHPPAPPFSPVPDNAEFWRQVPARERYARAALAALPRLVGLIDKNPFSPSFGSFDRSYWHYRTMDFPCGMSQEMVLPLALAHSWDLPGGGAWRDNERLRELVVGALRFARDSSHRDGTCDDYFPFERAMGALVFSLYAATESCLVLDLKNRARASDRFEDLLDFFALRGEHLGRKNETGQLANHQAFAALALYNVYLLTGDERFREHSDRRLELTLSWQNKDEGWFQEYEGADPGYHSCSIAFLAKLWQKSQDERIPEALGPAVDFAWHFMHPDGSYAGEYGSRNTYHFYPHGFEVMAGLGNEKARWIADMFLSRGLPGGTRYFNDDDRMAAHYVYDWMQSWRDFAPREETAPEPEPAPPVRRYFPAAGLAVRREGGLHVVANLRKGGAFKAATPEGPLASDTGPVLRLADGTTLVSHMMDASPERSGDADADEWTAAGSFHKRKHRLATPWTQMAFRLMTLTAGRFAPNLVRSILQKILITGKAASEFRFERTIGFRGGALEITDVLSVEGAPPVGTSRQVEKAAFGTDATSIYVANSNTFQRSVLLPWTWIGPENLKELNEKGRTEIARRVERPEAGA